MEFGLHARAAAKLENIVCASPVSNLLNLPHALMPVVSFRSTSLLQRPTTPRVRHQSEPINWSKRSVSRDKSEERLPSIEQYHNSVSAFE